jgi:membrane protease YdiL (CAAX protease family)
MDLWALVFFLVVIQPILGHYRFRRLIQSHGPLSTRRKLRAYALIVGSQWLLVAAAAWVLSRRGLSLSDLGLTGTPHPMAVLFAVTLTGSIVLATARTVRAFVRGSKDSLPSHIRKVARILPATPIERAGFVPVALTAGFCEEILYRGFLVFAFRQVLPSTGLALAATAVAFGFAHSYQGPRGVITTGVLGLILAGIYWYGRSLWPGIGLHAVVDLASGAMLGPLSRISDISPATAEPDVPFEPEGSSASGL